MPDIFTETCNRCGAEVSGPDRKNVRKTMARHRLKKGHIVVGVKKRKSSNGA